MVSLRRPEKAFALAEADARRAAPTEADLKAPKPSPTVSLR
jgi:hypothetical protein